MTACRRLFAACSPMSFVMLAALAIALTLEPLPAAAQSAQWDLARARTAYNERHFDEAIIAASAARSAPRDRRHRRHRAGARAARTLPRTRRSGRSQRRARSARHRRARARSTHAISWSCCSPSAKPLFLEDDFGAAAEMLESGLNRAAVAAPELAESMLEWWGSALERQASGLDPEPRKGALHAAG